jgi:hypothetical protein
MSSGLIPDTAPEPVERSLWQKWVGFWLPASDPTTLGFIRLTTGLLVLYIHLAYSVNLQQFFGKTGWYAHRFVERERLEYPWRVSPFWEWDPQSSVSAKLPDFPHRRKAVVEFMKNLPADEAKRKHSLRFLDRLAKYDNPEAPVYMLRWFGRMGMSDIERDRFLSVMVTPPEKELAPNDPNYYYYDNTPPILRGMMKPEREQLADEVRAFWEILPENPTDRAYVMEHITEVPHEIRKATVEFLLALPNDPKAREKKIEYLEYWNDEPEKSIRTGHPIFSVWFHVTDPTWMTIVHVGILFVIVLFTLGLFTRVTSVMVWIAVVGYIHRTQQVLFGMDTMMNILLFYLMVGNSGAALSIDRLIARYRAVRASLRRSGTIDPATRAFLTAAPPSRSAGFATRLIQVHFCFIYVAAGLAKLKGAAWWNGTATWDVFVNPEFTMMQYEWYEKMLRGLVSIKPFYYSMIIGGSWFTLFIEIAGPFLLWTRLRWLIIFLSTLMHAIIAVMMGLNLFELLMVVMVLAFIPDGVVRDRFRGAANLLKQTFVFNLGNAEQTRAAAMVAALDVDNQVVLAPDKGVSTPVVSSGDRKSTSDREGLELLSKDLRVVSALSATRGFLKVIAIGLVSLAAIGLLLVGLDSVLQSGGGSAFRSPATFLRDRLGVQGLVWALVGGAVTLAFLPAARALGGRLLFPPPAVPPGTPPTAPKPPAPAAAS